MSWEEVAALSAFGTLIVIAASAVAAIIQIRHMRSSNQMTSSLGLVERWATPEYRELINYITSGELEERLKDPNYRKSLARVPGDRLAHPEIVLLDFWEFFGSQVKLGSMSETSFMDVASSQCIIVWRKLTPVIAIIRRVRGPEVYDNFEYIASRSMMWEAKHPDGTYPKGTPHLPVIDEYIEDTAPNVP